MPFAVGVSLDPASAAVVGELIHDVLAVTGADLTHVSETSPHLTLAVAEEVEVPAVEQLLAEIAGSMPAPALTFSHLGVFLGDERVVFLASVVTAELIAFHLAFHRRFEAMARDQSPLYLPGRWVPHCTLARDLAPDAIPRAVGACGQLVLPHKARLSRIVLASFPAPDVRRAVALRQSQRPTVDAAIEEEEYHQ